MIAEQIARLIAHYFMLLEMSDDETIDPDTAVQAMETLAYDIAGLDKDFLRELIAAFPKISSEYNGETAELIKKIPEYLDMEDESADDPEDVTGSGLSDDGNEQER